MLTPPPDRLLFADPLPAPDPGASMFLIQRNADGETVFRADTDEPELFIVWLQDLFNLFDEHPALVRAAVLPSEAAIVGAGLRYEGWRDIPSPAPALREPE